MKHLPFWWTAQVFITFTYPAFMYSSHSSAPSLPSYFHSQPCLLHIAVYPPGNGNIFRPLSFPFLRFLIYFSSLLLLLCTGSASGRLTRHQCHRPALQNVLFGSIFHSDPAVPSSQHSSSPLALSSMCWAAATDQLHHCNHQLLPGLTSTTCRECGSGSGVHDKMLPLRELLCYEKTNTERATGRGLNAARGPHWAEPDPCGWEWCEGVWAGVQCWNGFFIREPPRPPPPRLGFPAKCHLSNSYLSNKQTKRPMCFIVEQKYKFI